MRNVLAVIVAPVLLIAVGCSMPLMNLRHQSAIGNQYQTHGELVVSEFNDNRPPEEKVEKQTVVNSMGGQVWSYPSNPKMMTFFKKTLMEEAGKPIAFEEHAHFVYLAGRPSASQEPSQFDGQEESRIKLVFLRPATLIVDVWPLDAKHADIGKPTAMSTVDVPLSCGRKSRRTVCVYHSPVQETARRTESIRMEGNICNVAINESDRTFYLVLPLDLRETAAELLVELEEMGWGSTNQ